MGNVPVNEQALAPYNASARLRLLCAAIIRTLLFVVMAVAKRRSGQRRNKSGGMKSLRVTFTRTQSFAGRAARGNGPDARKRGVFIF